MRENCFNNRVITKNDSLNFCPGWKAYFTSLDAEAQQTLRAKYDFKKYQ